MQSPRLGAHSFNYHWNLQRLGGPEGHAQGEKPEKRPHGGGNTDDVAIVQWQRPAAAVEEAKRLVGAWEGIVGRPWRLWFISDANCAAAKQVKGAAAS